MGNEHLLVQKAGHVLSLKLNRPEKLNAFSPSMIRGIIEALEEAKRSADIRVICLSGAGRAFSAGGDVTTMSGAKPNNVYDHIGMINELVHSIKEIEKPVIAVVHGFAAGAGFNLALACDLIIAADDAKFAMSFAQVGLISDGGGLFFLPRLIGIHRAKELLFNTEPIDADYAYRLGIVNKLYPLEQLESGALEYASRLAKGPIKAYGMIKKIADWSLTSSLDDILERERVTQAMMVTTEDHQEGVRAFIEKRQPSFNSL